ncbi:MAG TPA: hypothetical protein VHW09_07960 [Bryobacteraceae bacterium]|jgi:hypothetical protein|nr:hypothetical protein [Bryobacteraceae bacterium]
MAIAKSFRIVLALGGLTILLAPDGLPQPPVTPATTLDFQEYRAKIEPVFLKVRDNGLRCYTCHSVNNTRLHLERLTPGSDTWTEEQSRKNFESVATLVTPGAPATSRLLLHPLAPAAGGDPTHGGGKFWQSQSDPEWEMIAAWIRRAAPETASAPVGSTLSYDVFKSRVEPIFLEKRLGHARCYVCHKADAEAKKTNFRIQTLPEGAKFWTEEQSRKNFEAVTALVVPGDPLHSRLLMHPLAPQAGGDSYHTGGRQFRSKDDPDWQAIAAWVNGH